MKTVKVVRVIGGKREEIELPLSDAREMGILDSSPQTLSVAFLMDSLFVPLEGEIDDDECSSCHTSIRDVVLRQRVGCPHCYDQFADTVDRMLRLRRHRDSHADRIPVRLQRYRRLFVEREALLSQLSLAVEEEDFETAAGLRDQINRIGSDEFPPES